MTAADADLPAEIARLRDELAAQQQRASQAEALLAGAVERQTATAEVLRIIASTPTDAQPVFEAIVQSGARLTGADRCTIFIPRGEVLEPVAWFGTTEWGAAMPSASESVPIDRGRIPGRAFLESQTIVIPDAAAADPAEFPSLPQRVAEIGNHSSVLVPLLREGTAIGVISTNRRGTRPYTDAEVALFETFADQAVIAIENARLFNELQESLAQQTATADVLGIISGSPGDQEAALGAITEAAFRLCHASGARVWLREGDELVAGPAPSSWPSPGSEGARSRIPLAPNSPGGPAVLECRTESVADLVPYLKQRDAVPELLERILSTKQRSAAFVPLVRGEVAIGMLAIVRSEVRPFSEREIALAEGFADQAVIAIENARLFEEIRQKSRELEELNGQLEEANRHKSAFVATMSHELRTPLNAIIGYSEMLAEEAEEEGATSFVSDLGKINSSGKHLLSLINNILDLSKIEAGRMDLYLEDFSVQGVLTEVEAVARPLVEQKRNQFVLNVADEPGAMHADLTKVKQCLLNLLSNAAKFTEAGTVTLALQWTREADGDWLTFAITDTGIGMSEEQQGKLFQAFSQAEASTSSKYGGTGLGLSLSRSFAQLMGGDIAVTSEAGKGSTFTMRLPARVSVETPR